ncbi:MAG: TetR-like C-terminal domain-containing protein, partial [Myxococcota bacterium]
EALDRLWAVLGEDEDPIRRIQAMTRLYREIAHENATHYKIMLAHAVPNFAPAEESLEVGAQAFARLERGVAMAQGANRLDSSSSAEAIAHVLWATCHGMVSLELAAMVPPGVCAVQQYDRAVAAVLAGYRP